MDTERLRLLLTGLACGDSLGSTSEFVPRDDIPEVYERYKVRGWPFRQVGGGMFGWTPGAPTDDTDMAMCLVRSFLEKGVFDGEDVARRFVEWMQGRPRDIGGTTLRTLGMIAEGTPWHEGGLADFQRNPGNAANGSLMRNGVVPGMAKDLHDAFQISLSHGMMTHYAPLPQLCCAAQSYLIWELCEGHDVLGANWLADFRRHFTSWLDDIRDDVCQAWRKIVKPDLDRAWHTLEEANFDPIFFDPFVISVRGGGGYCLLTLEVAVWATAWSLRGTEPFQPPKVLPEEVFERRGPWVLSWVPLVGFDTDTYGATAGPMIAAAHGSLPSDLTDGLLALQGVSLDRG